MKMNIARRILAALICMMLVSGIVMLPVDAVKAEEPVVEEPVIEEPVVEEPVIEEPVVEEPVVEEPVVEEPVVEEPVVEEPVVEEPVVEEPVVEEPVVEEPVVEEPVVEEPVVEEPVVEEPVVEEPVVEEPVVEEPVVEINYFSKFIDGIACVYAEPDLESEVLEVLGDGSFVKIIYINDMWCQRKSGGYVLIENIRDTQLKPVVEEPVVEEPVVEEPVVEEPVVEEPVVEEPVVEEPVVEEPVVEEPVVEEPAVEEPAVEEPVVEEPVVEEPVVEEPVVEEPVAEEPVVEEPVVEEPVVEEPVVEEPVVEEPVVEENVIIIEEYETPLGIPGQAASVEAPEFNSSNLLTEEDLPENAMLLAEILDELNEERSINIYIGFEGDELHFGDEATLYAVLKGYEDCVFTVQWQISDDDVDYADLEGENNLTYSTIVTEENYTKYWRIVATITAVNVPDELLNGQD